MLLDCSGSMQLGSPPKVRLGAQLAAALAYVGLANQDHVRVSLFRDRLVAATRTLRGKTRIYDVLELVDSPPQGTTDLAEALDSFSKETRRPGVVFVISDFLDPRDVLPSIRLLASRRFGITALHLLAPEEIAPELSGDVELRDIETGRTRHVPLRRDTVERYRAFFRAHCDRFRSELRRYGVRYLRLTTDRELDEILFTLFPKKGLLR